MPAGGVDRHRQRGRAHEVEALGHDGPPVHDRVLRRAGAGCPAPVGGAGHDVAGADVGDAVADGFDGAGHVDPDAPGPLVPVQAAAQRPVGRGEAARVDGHTDPAGPRPGGSARSPGAAPPRVRRRCGRAGRAGIAHTGTRDELLAAVTGVLDAGRAAGDPRSDVAADDIAAALLGIGTVTAGQGERTGRLLDLLVDGLRPRGREG